MLKKKKTTTTNRNVVVPACRRPESNLQWLGRERTHWKASKTPKQHNFRVRNANDSWIAVALSKERERRFRPPPHTHTPITGSGAALNEDNVERVSPPATTGDHHRVGKRERIFGSTENGTVLFPFDSGSVFRLLASRNAWDRQGDFLPAAGTTERVINGRDGAKRQQGEKEFFIRRNVKILARHLKFFEVEKCVWGKMRAREYWVRATIFFFSFFFVWKRNTKQLELLRSKKLQNTHTQYT